MKAFVLTLIGIAFFAVVSFAVVGASAIVAIIQHAQ